MTKLYDAPSQSVVELLDDIDGPPDSRPVKKGELINFHHIDGMYSFCHDSEGNVVYLPAWSEVKVVEAL